MSQARRGCVRRYPGVPGEAVQTLCHQRYRKQSPEGLQVLQARGSEGAGYVGGRGRIVSKPFGKVTIYCCKEQDLELPKGVDVNKVTYDLISELREELRLLEKEKSTLLEKKNALFSEPENDKLLDVLATLRESERDIDAKLDNLERNWDPTNQKEINELKNLEKTLKKDLASRKKLINDLLAIIKESGLLKKGETIAELLVCVMEIKSIFYLSLFILISLFFIDRILTKQNFI